MPSTAESFVWHRSLVALLALGLALLIGIQIDFWVLHLTGTTMTDIAKMHLTYGIALGQLASYVPLLITLLVVVPWVAQRSLMELGITGIDLHVLGYGVGGAAAMYVATILAAAVQYEFVHAKPSEPSVTLFTSTHDVGLLVTFAALATIVAPFMEEFAYRGFLFNALRRYLPVWAAAVISGLLFGYSHGSLTAVVPLACAGIVLAYVYDASRSLTAAMISHGLFNLFSIVLITVAK